MKYAILFAICLIAAPAMAQQATWDKKFFNPRPIADNNDFVLPLPCGGSMVFRPVDLPFVDGPLADGQVPLGDPERASGPAEYFRTEYISAPFPVTPAGGRRYWIGKYVVSSDQYAAMRGTCSGPDFAGMRAKTGVAYIDAMQATSDWSAWLLQNARASLPKRGTAFAYVRLPTEAEWEFAARGGRKVTAEQFRGRIWPVEGNIERYVVSGNAADGKPQRIGAAELPNPLGLYDVLGSVDQMMLEPFRLNHVGRLHGDAGGIIIRGGNFKDQPGDVRIAMRSELLPFDPAAGKPMRTPTAGFRVVLSAPSAGDLPEATAQKSAFATMTDTRAAEFGDQRNPRDLVQAMRKEGGDKVRMDALARLDTALAEADARLSAANAARDEQDRVTMRAEIESASIMANFIWGAERNVRISEAVIKFVNATAERVATQTGGSQVPPAVAALEANQRRAIDATRAEQTASLDGYLQSLREISKTARNEDVQRQADILRREMDARGQKQVKAFLALVVRHAGVLRASNTLPPDTAKKDILSVPASGQ